jgi:transposase
LNLHDGQEIVMRSPIMNAETSALFLQKILVAVPDAPILLLWDRATWHRGPQIKTVLAAHPRLEIMYLPTAAPDLNPQEHVWKATRGAVSHNHSHKKLDQLADDFENHLKDNTFPCPLLEKYGYTQLCMMFK